MQQDQIAKDINKLNKLFVKIEDRPTSSTSLLKKVKSLYHKLFRHFSTGKIKKIALGSAAALLLQTNATAQTFSFVNSSNANLYGLNTSKISASQPIFRDLDNDGDQDIIFGTYGGSNLKYVPNITPIAGNPINFGASQTNPFSYPATATIAGTIDLADLDNDGDFDIFLGTYDAGYSSDITYVENTGTNIAPNFSTTTLNPFNLTIPANTISYNINFVDLDGDGDFDILMQAGVYYVTTNLYFQNTGTVSAPDFAAPQTNPFGLNVGGVSLSFIDIDKDGDQDIFYTDSGFLKYQENTGSASAPAFATPTNNPFSLKGNYLGNAVSLINFVDLDNDGDKDYVGKTATDVFVQFNMTPTSVGKVQKQDLDISIYPTPSHDIVNIKLGKQDDYTLEVFNLQGQQLQVQNIQQATEHQLNLSELASGQYLLKISTDDHYTTKQLIKQ